MAITAKLYLYTSFTPNIKGSFYFPYDNVYNYYNKVLNEHVLMELTEDSYRINNGTAIVNVASNSQLASFKKVTYIAQHITDDSTDDWTFYHVKRFYSQSRKAFFELAIDNFATYWKNAEFHRATITRCNRLPIWNGHAYPCAFDGDDWCPSPINDSDFKRIVSDELDTADFLTIAQIRFVTNSDMFGNSPITQTMNFVTTDSPQRNIPALGTIFAVKVNSGTTTFQGKAQVVQAWSIPKVFLPDALDLDPSGIYIPRYKDITDNYSEKDWKGGYGYYPFSQAMKHTYTFEIKQYANYRYYVGTRGALISLPRKFSSETRKTSIAIDTTLDSAGVKVMLRVDGQVTDITGAFSVLITYNNEVSPETERVVNGLKTLTNFVSGVGKTYEKRGSMGVAYDAYGTFLNQYHFNNPQTSIGEGEADLTFEYNSETKKYKFPIGYVAQEITGNYVQEYRQRGLATYVPCWTGEGTISIVEYMKAIDDCVSLCTPDQFTFIVADVDVTGIPIEPANSIREAFANGIDYCFADAFVPDD